MADLILFATITTDLNLDTLSDRFNAPIRARTINDELHIESEFLQLNIIASGSDEMLMRGRIEDIDYFKRHILSALKGAVTQVQIDLFEEDGRLIQRLTAI